MDRRKKEQGRINVNNRGKEECRSEEIREIIDVKAMNQWDGDGICMHDMSILIFTYMRSNRKIYGNVWA